MKEHIPDVKEFDYSAIDSVARIIGTHPIVKKDHVSNQTWKVEIDTSKKKLSFRFKVLLFWKKITGIWLVYYRKL